MADIPISSMTVLVGSIPSGSYLEISTPDVLSSTGFSTYRTTPEQIAATAVGFVPITREISTPTTGGLAGGGTLNNDLSLTFEPVNLTAKAAMVVADVFAINDSVLDEPAKVTFPNAMKALTGLPVLNLPNLANDYLIINKAADGETYKINVSSFSLATGNVPAGGATGKPLIKLSGTDYDTAWATLPAIGGGTGFAAYTLGDTLYADTTTTLAKLAGNTTTAKQYLSQTGTGAVSAAPAWATIAGADITGAALTKVDDANVTLTLGGTPATALLRAASITAGWTGQLGLTRGGTAASLVASNGGIVYSTAAALAILAGTATASQMLVSGSSAAPAWSTNTWPTTNAQGDLLYGSASNVISALAKSASATRYLANTGSSNNPNWDQVNLTNGVTGTLPVGNGGTGIAAATAHYLLVGAGTSPLVLLAPSATSGIPLISQGASADPAYGTAVVAGGGTGAVTLTANGVLLGNGTGAVSASTPGTNGQVLMGNTSSAPTFQGMSTSITFIFDGGGTAISTGIKGDLTIPFAYTITEWTLLGDQSGSIVIDIWADTYANYPPTVADTITAAAKPTISTATKGQSSTLTAWTTTQPAGNTLRFNVDSVTTLTRVTLSLKVTRTSA